MPETRVKVGIRLDPEPSDLVSWLGDAAAFDAAGADALWVELVPAPDRDPVAVLAALAVVTFRALLVTAPLEATETIDRLARGRLRLADQQEESWLAVEPPQGRADWRAVMAGAAEQQHHGVIVPIDPRLLDLLRNPDDEVDRRDLQLSIG